MCLEWPSPNSFTIKGEEPEGKTGSQAPGAVGCETSGVQDAIPERRLRRRFPRGAGEDVAR